MLRGIVNPVTGRLEWVLQDRDVSSEDSDLSPELARSQYGDMLHDTLRNQLYCRALEHAVGKVKAMGREPHVLDIGTGTGLLAMMAARAGATRVTACEVLLPMVKISRQVIKENGYSGVISVVPKRSTEMTEEDMEGGRANILVTEVFDTDLIGEGGILTFVHAHKHLLQEGTIVIPRSATVFVQLVQSELLWNSHKLLPEKFPVPLSVPVSWTQCSGPPSLWDLHVEQVTVPQQLQVLSQPTEIARFPFQDRELSSDHSSPPVVVEATESGLCHGVVMWWSIDLEGEELSMSPWDYRQWRDHWLQAVQLLPQPMPLTKGEVVSVACDHDDYAVWFTVSKERLPPTFSVESPLCTCGMHTMWSRTRLAMLNDRGRNDAYLSALTKCIAGKSTVLCISDGSLLPILVAKAGIPTVKQVFVVQDHSTRVMNGLFDTNSLTGTVQILDKQPQELTRSDFGDQLIDAVIGEPYFFSSLLPWHNLHFWYATSALRDLLAPDCLFLPKHAFLKAIAVSFEDLYKVRAPVGVVEGFDISAFDRTVGKVTSSEEGVEPEPHPLWEYPSYARSAVCELMKFDLTSLVPKDFTVRSHGSLSLGDPIPERPCHGVVLWMDYLLADGITSSTGLLQEPKELGEKLAWDPGFKQAVYFLPPHSVDTARTAERLQYSVQFHTATGQLDLLFSSSSTIA